MVWNDLDAPDDDYEPSNEATSVQQPHQSSNVPAKVNGVHRNGELPVMVNTPTVSSSRTWIMAGGGVVALFQFGYVGVLQTGGVLLFALLALIISKQEGMLYIPHMDQTIPRHNRSNPSFMRSPSEYDIPFLNAAMKTDDGETVHAWLLLHKSKTERKNVPTFIYFHGNAGNIGNRLPLLDDLWNLVPCNILAVDYRGYGDSTGTPNEKGLRLDAKAALRFLRTQSEIINTDRICVFGRSLGGAVAVALAATSPDCEIQAVVLENTFTSILDMALILMPFLWMLQPFIRPPLLRNEWASHDHIHRIRCPILFVSGAKDSLIPQHHMIKLYSKSSQTNRSVSFKSIANGDHNNTPNMGGREYYDAITGFLASITWPQEVPQHEEEEEREGGEEEHEHTQAHPESVELIDEMAATA